MIPDREAFVAGKISFMVGGIENPYHPYDQFDEHREWQRGFDRAYFENISLVKRYEIESSRRV
jgi:hypothetical protein